MKPPPLVVLTARHEKAVEQFANKSSKPFAERLHWLIAQIRKELPQIGGVVYCNGDSWFVPVDYPKQQNASVPVFDENDMNATEDVFRILDAVGLDCGAKPRVSTRCLKYIKEVYDLTTYCSGSRLHTLEPQETIVP